MSEKYGFLFMSRFGVRAYDYWWGYTKAQIHLMTIDAPISTYKSKDKNPTAAEMSALSEEWRKRKGNGTRTGRKLTIGELFNGVKEDKDGKQ